MGINFDFNNIQGNPRFRKDDASLGERVKAEVDKLFGVNAQQITIPATQVQAAVNNLSNLASADVAVFKNASSTRITEFGTSSAAINDDLKGRFIASFFDAATPPTKYAIKQKDGNAIV